MGAYAGNRGEWEQDCLPKLGKTLYISSQIRRKWPGGLEAKLRAWVKQEGAECLFVS